MIFTAEGQFFKPFNCWSLRLQGGPVCVVMCLYVDVFFLSTEPAVWLPLEEVQEQ